nr:MAG TPA: hypothetical protein [Caudoviricetes sp.]
MLLGFIQFLTYFCMFSYKTPFGKRPLQSGFLLCGIILMCRKVHSKLIPKRLLTIK